jgi:RNA polymerase sigma-70 factor, ECF subfamily
MPVNGPSERARNPSRSVSATAPADQSAWRSYEGRGPIVASPGSLRVALVAALQHLPARQRVVLILRNLLAWPAAEVAELPTRLEDPGCSPGRSMP